MSATEELRRMLDERGVEYTTNDGEYVKETCWPYMGELAAAFAEYYNGTTRFVCDTWCFTPEQAVEATMGRKEYVYALTAIDPEDGREYMLGIYATRELVEKSIETNGRGYALHYVSRWEVVDE